MTKKRRKPKGNYFSLFDGIFFLVFEVLPKDDDIDLVVVERESNENFMRECGENIH